MAQPKLSLRRVLIISRPFWWVNTGVPFAVGALLSQNFEAAAAIIGFLYFLIPYNLLMYGVNDIYDYESDIKNPRKNGSIDGSVLAKPLHGRLWLVMAAANMPFLALFAATGNIGSTIFLGVMVFMVFAYSHRLFRYKEVPVLDSLTSSFHYSSPFIFGLLYFFSESLYLPIFAAFYLWVAANHAFGAIQDIIPDRKAGIGSVAVSLGAERTLYLCFFLYLAAAIIPVAAYGASGLLGTAAVAPYLYLVAKCLPERRNEKSKLFGKNWRRFLYINYAIGALGTIMFLYIYFKPL